MGPFTFICYAASLYWLMLDWKGFLPATRGGWFRKVRLLLKEFNLDLLVS